jgi:hypothetical protein
MDNSPTANPDASTFSLDQFDLSPLVATADSRVHGNGPGTKSWSQGLDISLGATSDPGILTGGRISIPSNDNALNSFDNAYDEIPQLMFDHNYNDSSAIPDLQRASCAGDFRASLGLPIGYAAYHCSLPKVKASASSFPSPVLVVGPTVCSLAYEQSDSGLNFDSRRPIHDFGTYWPPYSSLDLRSRSDNVADETPRSDDVAIVGPDDRKLEQPTRHIGARTRSARLHREPGATQSIVHTGEMFFDTNMQNIQPRRLRKKTSQERELYLTVRKHGGACEKHKQAKRAVSTVSSGTSEILRLS